MDRIPLFAWQLYTHGNYGDTVLAEAVHYLFHSFGNRQCFRFADGADLRYPIGPRLVERANRQEAGVICGGGHIIPRNLERSGWAFNSTIAQARQLRRTIVFAVGFNLYKQHSVPKLFRSHFEAIIENSPFVGLRNYGSIERVKEIVDAKYHNRLFYQPCPTTFIRELVEEFDPSSRPERRRRVVLQVTLSAGDSDVERMKREVLSACRQLSELGYRVGLASFFDRLDTPIADHLRESGFHDFDFVTLNTAGRDVLSGPRYFSEVPITVATRGHGAMVPFGAGSVVVPISLAPKVVYFAEAVGISDLLVDVDDPDLAGSIVRRVEYCHTEYESIQARLQAERRHLYDLTLDNMARIYHALSGVAVSERDCVPLNEFEVFLSSRIHAVMAQHEARRRDRIPAQPQAEQPTSLQPARTSWIARRIRSALRSTTPRSP